MAARSDLASGTCSIHPLSPRTGDDEHVSLGGWRSSGNAHFVGHSSWRRERTYRRASGGCSARVKMSSGTTIGIVHAHLVGRSKIDLTSISDTKMFGMCRIQYDKEISYLYPTKRCLVCVGYNPTRKYVVSVGYNPNSSDGRKSI